MIATKELIAFSLLCVSILTLFGMMSSCIKLTEKELTKRQYIAGTNILHREFP